MALTWFDARDAAIIGIALADQFAPRTETASDGARGKHAASRDRGDGSQELFARADREVRPLRLNLYKKAKFANSFKWRLLENGVDKKIADEMTQRLLVYLSMNQARSAPDPGGGTAPAERPRAVDRQSLLTQGNQCIARGAYAEAVTFFRDLIRLEPRHATAHSNLGAALCKLGRYKEAESHFREAIKIAPDFADAHSNLGNLLRWNGESTESERWLRRALKLNPRFEDARVNLGLTLAFMGRTRDANAQFEKVLKVAPRNPDALVGLAFVAKTEGRFDEASAHFKRALEINPKLPGALAGQAGLRKMTAADGAWIEAAEQLATGGIGALDEAELRFAMGKYCDDVGNFKRAFESYKRANELLKPMAEPYARDAHRQFVDDLIRLYSRETLAQREAGSVDSARPVFVVGMPRSGTSLMEQIIASHPSAQGAGELEFWMEAVRVHAAAIRQGRLDEPARKKLAEGYLRLLESFSSDALRIVDKAPVNSDHLGLIHSIFPNARIIHMQRDPIDTCLSCYFQQFSLSMTFTMDLSDLAHYYREHRRLMAHWHEVLPPGTILKVPYEELVADQEGWTRRVLEFIGLGWDEHCLEFQETNRPVVTSSFWQVRQKIFRNSVMRWRNYERFIGPLLSLK